MGTRVTAHRLSPVRRPRRPRELQLLERVPLLDKHLDDYADVVEPGTIERIRALAEPLRGARVLHLNATAYGGGVAELLATHVALLRDVGIDAEWHVIHGSDEFFAVTKTVHNALQGADVEWTPHMEHIYLERVLDNALQLEGEWDFVVIHDPQPAAMRDYARGHGVAPESTKWIWRCHIDLTDANPQVFEFFRPFVEHYDASVWTMPQFVPDSMPKDRIVIAPPCIDPLSVKNLDLPRSVHDRDREAVRRAARTIRSSCRSAASIPWKDPIGVIEAYRIVKEEFPTVQLVLAGSMATDDPGGLPLLGAGRRGARRRRERPPAVEHPTGRQRADQRVPTLGRRRDAEVAARRLRPHRERRALEGPARHRRALRRHHAADRRRRERLPRRRRRDRGQAHRRPACARRSARPRWASAGREFVRRNFLSTRELEDWLRLYGELQ